MLGKRGRPKGSTKATKSVLKEWSNIYNEHGDVGKAIVLKRVDELGLEKDLIIEQLAILYSRNTKRIELKPFANAETTSCVNKLQEAVKKSASVLKLQALCPQNNITINLESLEVGLMKRPTRREKKNNVRQTNQKTD
jgi:hypothetical protein